MYFKSCKLDFDKDTFTSDNGHIKVEGVVSSYGNMDSYGDIIKKGAFTKSIQQKPTVKLVVNHESRDITKSVGEITLSERGDSIYGEGYINAKYPIVKNELLPRMEDGIVNDFSIRIGADAKVERLKEGRLLFKEASIADVSFVLFPANENARIVSFSKSEKDIAEQIEVLKECNSMDKIEEFLFINNLSKEETSFLIKKVIDLQKDAIVAPYIKEANQLRILSKLNNLLIN